jgi:glutaredoxin-like protein
MAFIDERTGNEVRTALEALERDVELLVYTASNLVVPGRDEPGEQGATLELLREVAGLSSRLEVVERQLSTDEARLHGIELAPTILLREKGGERTNIRFVGLPSGYEFQTLIGAILLLGGGNGNGSAGAAGGTSSEALAGLAAPIRMRSFVTPTCPYCPQAVLTAFRLALHNPKIVAEGIEANEFPLLSRRYRISGVPDTIIEGESRERVLGGQPERVFVDAVRRAAGMEA